jgi:hypothetical protein
LTVQTAVRREIGWPRARGGIKVRAEKGGREA